MHDESAFAAIRSAASSARISGAGHLLGRGAELDGIDLDNGLSPAIIVNVFGRMSRVDGRPMSKPIAVKCGASRRRVWIGTLLVLSVFGGCDGASGKAKTSAPEDVRTRTSDSRPQSQRSIPPGAVANFLRNTIESYPAAEAKPILEFLDGGRLVCDEWIRRLFEGEIEELTTHFERILRRSKTRPQIAAEIENLRTCYGAVRNWEYQCQSLQAPGPEHDVHDLTKAVCGVFYVVRTTKRKDGELFLQVRAARMNDVWIVFNFEFSDYKGLRRPAHLERSTESTPK